jgi:hypothetical protein
LYAVQADFFGVQLAAWGNFCLVRNVALPARRFGRKTEAGYK